MEQNSELVDFERGSTFGGIMTAFVFIGFIGILMYDLTENIRNKPYTFTVRENFLSAEEQRSTVVNGDEYQQSLAFFAHFTARDENGLMIASFDPLDNDYIDIYASYWDTGLNKEEGKSIFTTISGPELVLCSEE